MGTSNFLHVETSNSVHMETINVVHEEASNIVHFLPAILCFYPAILCIFYQQHCALCNIVTFECTICTPGFVWKNIQIMQCILYIYGKYTNMHLVYTVDCVASVGDT